MYLSSTRAGVVLSITDPSLSQPQSLLKGDLTGSRSCMKSLPGRQAPALASAFSLVLPKEDLWGKLQFLRSVDSIVLIVMRDTNWSSSFRERETSKTRQSSLCPEAENVLGPLSWPEASAAAKCLAFGLL